MESITDIYKIGNGPSSSHTMGPKKAAEIFDSRNPEAYSFRVTLYGSLANTGKGHMTDWIIEKTLKQKTEIIWKFDEILPLHPNGMLFEALNQQGSVVDNWEVYSVGGGAIMDSSGISSKEEVYNHNTMAEILAELENNGGSFWEFVIKTEGEKSLII